jgi:hypothetical protein
MHRALKMVSIFAIRFASVGQHVTLITEYAASISSTYKAYSYYVCQVEISTMISKQIIIIIIIIIIVIIIIIIGSMNKEMAEEDCIMRRFITCTLHQILLGRSNQGV